MTSVNQQDFSDNTLETLIISNLVRQIENDKKNADPKALLATLSKSLEEVLDAIGSGGKSGSDKIVDVDFRAPASSSEETPNSQVPSNATMEQAIGQLMGLLAELEAEIAKFGNQKAQYDSNVGKDLINEMQAQVNLAQKNLSKTLKSIHKEHFWSIFTKVAEAVVGALIAGIALILGQPELAAIVIIMTVLAVSGGMDKATDGIADLLQKIFPHMSPEVAHIIAAVIIVIASIVITVVTCGAGAEGTVEATIDAAGEIGEDVGEEGIEMTDMAVNNTETSVETTSEAAEQTQTFMQRVENFFSKVAEWIKNNNPFRNVPKNWNLGIVAGSMAFGSTNFSQYAAELMLSHMKDGKTKEALMETIEIVLNLLAALAGAGAGAAVAAGPAMYQLNNVSTLLKGLYVGQTAAGLTQATGEFGLADAQYDQAEVALETGDTDASLNLLRALLTLNSSQSQADSKALNSELRAKAEGFVTLTADLAKESAAVADVLRQ